MVRIASAAEDRFQRWATGREYDQWLQTIAPQADRLGRAQAIQSMGIGRTIHVPVVVHDWSAKQQTGAVSLDLPSNFSVDANNKPYDVPADRGLQVPRPTAGPGAPGADVTATFKLTTTGTALPAQPNLAIPIHTYYVGGGGWRRRGRDDYQSCAVTPTECVGRW